MLGPSWGPDFQGLDYSVCGCSTSTCLLQDHPGLGERPGQSRQLWGATASSPVGLPGEGLGRGLSLQTPDPAEGR